MAELDLCRLCAESKPDIIGIYDAEGQKLSIHDKIAKYLHIEIAVTDGLPHSVCIDCCVLLNQCSEFYEQTNQAQASLKQLFIESSKLKISQRTLEHNTEYIEKTENFSTEEQHSAVELAETSYVTESVNNDINDCYYNDDNHVISDTPKDVTDEISAHKKKSITVKKSLFKETKKKIKRKTNSKSSSIINACTASSVTDNPEKCLEIKDTKTLIKIPDNYMTGTDSDMEIIDKRTRESQNNGKKGSRGETLDRYPWLCTDCNDKLPSFQMLEKHHQSVHNQQPKYMCVQCCKVYDKYYGFLTHVKRHKNKLKFNCDDCGKTFVHKKVLDSHRAIHSEERPHICQTCGKAFRQQSALYVHSRCHLPDTMKNRFPCDQCDKRFSTKPNLVTHKRIHSGVRNFTCDQCGKSFIQKGNLEAHFLTHSADKPYNCTQCPKAFKTPLQLKKHETVHTGAKPHQCAVCGRTFREKGTLREHHRIHTGAMPFTCEFCGKCFRFKGILTTHRRQHTGERPYSCLECQHHFTNWPNYNKHMKRRHGINTSHTKHLQQPQPQSNSQEPSEQEQEQQMHVLASNPDEETTLSQHATPTVEVMETGPHITSQPIVVQAIPTTTIQTFQGEIPVTVQASTLRDRSANYFNAVPTLQNFLPNSHLSYNFYNISNVSENDLIQPR
ncbi:hypothetical protein PV326_005090 [Microctonus aethiopoides]|uniref:Uncharacterized protein n=1 Tax=Microctonus aethiopoides TaxID=144406 RepID=A0AA39FLA8_9HYME|nr:hypothetical protein PV326_005090 [Microctonus aethiopoides]KAK0171568.1 hypothetical protein PV328_005009 [Microctonus aethiopoides]